MLLFKGNAVVLLERAYLPHEGSLERRRGGRASWDRSGPSSGERVGALSLSERC